MIRNFLSVSIDDENNASFITLFQCLFTKSLSGNSLNKTQKYKAYVKSSG